MGKEGVKGHDGNDRGSNKNSNGPVNKFIK